MPRYFFNVVGDGYTATDAEGSILDGPKEASAIAVMLAGDLLRDADGRFWMHPDWRLTISDEAGGTMCVLSIQGARTDHGTL